MQRAAILGLLLSVVACTKSEPTPTGTVCAQPDTMALTYENFGQTFMATYCTWCHDSALPRSKRNEAPIYHDYNSLLGVLETAGHVDEQAGFGPDAENTFMPPERCPTIAGGPLDRDCPRPTDEERRQLAAWLACEVDRDH